ncbi:MAG TPA: glycoside hydrolase family 3 C-terminal domain-containing protein [Acidimicrobiales bacterium]|nr:glycoside hydrolase family 3 C-terminal domain-containing protein [Acidimicrobiales bacterium]
MTPGDTTANATGSGGADGGDDDADFAARLADPVLATIAGDEAPGAAPPDVWGRLVPPGWSGAPAEAPGGPATTAAPGMGEPRGGPRTTARDRASTRPIAIAVEARARELLDQLSEHEKLHLLSGDGPLVRGLREMRRRYNETPYVAGEVPRLGIPGIRFSDGPRGVVVGHATAFPVPMARAATFDPALEERVGDVIGTECRASGANLFAGVCANVLRHPAWGRAQESYGEDPHLVGEMAAALVRGTQRHVMACVKHLACNSMEDARFKVDVTVDADDLRDVYLPAFRRCVDEGVAAVMTAYNRVNGERCGHHRHLITDVLKGEWGFDGFVMSDFVLGVRSARAVAAGQDLEMPFRWRFKALGRLVRHGKVPAERVDDAALRLLRQQVRFAAEAAQQGQVEANEGARDGRADTAEAAQQGRTDASEGAPGGRAEAAAAGRYNPARIAGEPHRALARLVAERSMVLLRNQAGRATGPVLPIDSAQVQSVAVIGRLAAEPVTGDHGSSHVRAPHVVTLLDGLRAAGERLVIDVGYHRGDDLDAARLAAQAADVAVVVAGYTHRDEGENMPGGEGGDRRSLSLHPGDEALIRTVGAANPRSIVVLVGGGAIVTDSWRDQVGAVLMAWYPGMEGGHALARVLFGDTAPGGRLPSTWPRGAEQLPPFDPDARAVRYGPLHGYRLMEATGRSPAFPFGFGLSYTTFELGRVEAVRGWDGGVRLTVPVVNTGTRDGDEVVQVYLDEALGSEPRALRTLRAFRRVTVAAGEIENVTIALGPDDLSRTTAAADGRVRLHVGRDADPAGHRTIEV